MPKYSGPVMAAGAIGNALGDMFKGMAEGEERMPQVANAWQNFRTAQQQYAHNDQMNPLRVAQLQGSNQQQGVQTGLLQEELLNRPTLRQHQANQETRAGESHGWARAQEGRAQETHGREGERFGWDRDAANQRNEAYRRQQGARDALAAFVQQNGGKLDFSNPRSLQAFNALLAQHGGELAQHPLTQEGLKYGGPAGSPDGAIARLLQRDPSTLQPHERALVEQHQAKIKAEIDANNALANQRNSRAGFWQSKKGGQPIETDKLERMWGDMNKRAIDDAKLYLRDNLGIQNPKMLGSTIQEMSAALDWAKKLSLSQQLEYRPVLAEYITETLGRPFPTYQELVMNPPEHLKPRLMEGSAAWSFLTNTLPNLLNFGKQRQEVSPQDDPLGILGPGANR